MDAFWQGLLPLSLLNAALVQGSCQLLKFLAYSWRDRRWDFQYLVSSGGMPSSHTAFVTALILRIGLKAGPASEVFAVAFVFGAIVIHDSFRLRGTVQDQSRVLNRVAARLAEKGELPPQPRLNESVGHTPPEIVGGIIAGLVLGLPLALLLP